MMRFAIAAFLLATAIAPMPVIDNDRVTVWDVTSGDPFAPKHSGDTMWISLSRPGEVAFRTAGQRFDPAALGGRAIAIDLKDKKVEPLANTSGYPNAFPRRRTTSSPRWTCSSTSTTPPTRSSGCGAR